MKRRYRRCFTGILFLASAWAILNLNYVNELHNVPQKQQAKTMNKVVVDVEEDSVIKSNSANKMCEMNLIQNQNSLEFQSHWQSLYKITREEVLRNNSGVRLGGFWSPLLDSEEPCTPREKLAVIIPFRAREENLLRVLSRLHYLLQKQKRQYHIFVIEQIGNGIFNKGLLMNAGFLESQNMTDADCFVFHDVDLIPLNEAHIYSCEHSPAHFSVNTTKNRSHRERFLSYDSNKTVRDVGKLFGMHPMPLGTIAGGVLLFNKKHFETVNGFSNFFWGWGSEDRDMYNRVENKYKLYRPAQHEGSYVDLGHDHAKRVPKQENLELGMSSSKRQSFDGINSASYKKMSVNLDPLFTRVYVDVGRRTLETMYSNLTFVKNLRNLYN